MFPLLALPKIGYLCENFLSMNRLNKELRDTAIGYGLCQQWQDEWNRDYTDKELIGKFFDGMDFCIEHGYPTNEFIKKNFGKDFLRENNVLVDDKYSLLNPTNTAVFGDSVATARYNAFHSGRIWCKDNAKVNVMASGYSFVIVHAFGSAVINVTANDSSKIVLVRHSASCETHCKGNIIVREEYYLL